MKRRARNHSSKFEQLAPLCHNGPAFAVRSCDQAFDADFAVCAIRAERTTRWSGRPDLNRGPHAPQACALPDCATPRRTLQGYHRRSRRVKKARSESRISSSILRFKSCAAPYPGPIGAPVSESVPAVPPSRKCLRAPAIVNPSS